MSVYKEISFFEQVQGSVSSVNVLFSRRTDAFMEYGVGPQQLIDHEYGVATYAKVRFL